MTARKRLDEMKQFMKIAEGAWDLPRSKEDFNALAAILNSKEPNVKIQDMLYNILGDDNLFDRLDKLDPQGFDAPEVIIQWMKDQRKDPHSNFPNIWNTYQLSQRHDSPMNEVGRTSLDDYREETDDEWEARVSQAPIEDEEYGPAARGKSDIMKKYGAQQSIEVTDLSLSDPLDENEVEDFQGTLKNPQYKERRTAEIAKRKERLARTTRSGKPIPDDLYMARVKTPKGIGTVYSINNLEPTDPEAFPHPTVSVRLDTDQGGFGGGKMQYRYKLSDVEVLPDELDEVGDVKFDDYGVTENKADECKRCSGVGHHPSKPNVECPECLGTGKASVIVKPEGMQEPYRPENRPHTPGYTDLSGAEQYAADSRAQAFIFDEDSIGESEELPPIHAIANDIIKNWKKVYFGAVPYLRAMQTLSTKHDDYGADSGSSILAYGLGNMNHYSGRSVHDPELAKKHRAQLKQHLKEEINLSGIVETILQEFPGQPKDDYDELESDQAEFDTAIDAGAEMDDFVDEIDSEIADHELGYRFD